MSHLAQVPRVINGKVRKPSKDSDEFFTPARIFDPLHAEFGFTVDVASCAEAAKVPRYYDIQSDGLAQSWSGERVFLNPPYSDIEPWVAAADREVRFNDCSLVVALLPANKTEQGWWQEYVERFRDGRRPLFGVTVETRFLRKRIAFGKPGNPKGTGSGTFASVLVVWRRT